MILGPDKKTKRSATKQLRQVHTFLTQDYFKKLVLRAEAQKFLKYDIPGVKAIVKKRDRDADEVWDEIIKITEIVRKKRKLGEIY